MSGQQTVRRQTLPDAEQTIGEPGGDGLAAGGPGRCQQSQCLGGLLPSDAGRLGAPKAMTATAHKLARLVYSMLRYGTAYVDAGQQAYEQKYRDRVLTNLQRKAKTLGYQLVHVEDIDGGAISTL